MARAMTVPIIRNLLDAVPAADHAEIMGDAIWYRYTCSYRHQGGEFTFDIWALSLTDAEARMQSLRGNATVDGQVHSWVDA